MLHFVDSQVCLGVLAKGRSSSRLLRRTLGSIAALVIAGDLCPCYGFSLSETTPSDIPFRNVVSACASQKCQSKGAHAACSTNGHITENALRTTLHSPHSCPAFCLSQKCPLVACRKGRLWNLKHYVYALCSTKVSQTVVQNEHTGSQEKTPCAVGPEDRAQKGRAPGHRHLKAPTSERSHAGQRCRHMRAPMSCQAGARADRAHCTNKHLVGKRPCSTADNCSTGS